MSDFNINLPSLKLEFVPAILALIVFAGFFAIIFICLFYTIPPENEKIIYTVLGLLGSMVTAIVSFYFGSSKSTQTKDATIAAVTKTLTENVGTGTGNENQQRQ